MQTMNNFYDNLDLKYPEIAIALEDINKTNPGLVKFSIPILTPSLDNSKKVSNIIHQNPGNLRNTKKTALEISNITISNYVEIPLNKALCIDDYSDYIPAGSKWIVVFIGGDITKPQIIGRYIE